MFKVIEELIERKRFLFSLGGLGSLWITIGVTIVETFVIIKRIEGIHGIMSLLNPYILTILLAYLASVIALPLTLASVPEALKELSRMYRRVAERSGTIFRISKLRSKVVLLNVTIPLSSLCLLIALSLGNAFVALAGFVPLVIALLILLAPLCTTIEHSRRIELELPWFAILLEICEYVGAGLRFLSDRIRTTRILKAIARELDAIDRDSKLRSSSYIDAMMRRSETTTSSRFSRFLRGYVTRIRSGADVVQWLKLWILEEFMRSEFSYRLFSERASILISQLAIGIYVFIPIVIATLGSASPSSMYVIPLLGTPALIALAYVVRPRTLDAFDTKSLILSHIVLIATSIALYKFLGCYSIIVGWIAAIMSSFNLWREARASVAARRDVSEVLNEVIELRRLGVSIPSALRNIIYSSSLSPSTKTVLENTIKLHEMGVPLTETVKYLRTSSFLHKFVVFSLGLMHESGSNDVSAIHRLLELLRRMLVMEESAKKISILFDGLAIATMFIVVWISKTLATISKLFQSSAFVSVAAFATLQLQLLIPISMLGYALVSTVLRFGIPMYELRQLIFVAITLAALLMLHTF